MVFGYTPFDPLVVLVGTVLAIWFLARSPVRLLGFMPTALSLYFFIPTITLLTLWQTIPMLLVARVILLARVKVAPFAKAIFAITAVAIVFSFALAVFPGGGDTTRALIRLVYYMGAVALFSFCYEVGRTPQAIETLLKGFLFIGVVYAVYGLYQIVAIELGLPLRGILRGTYAADMALEGGIVRINSLANEPKRLGYVLFLCGLAGLFLARLQPGSRKRLTWVAGGILFMSLFTFAGSYFLTLVLFALVVPLLYPSRATKYLLTALAFGAVVTAAFPDLGILEAIREGYERRAQEVEVGLDGTVVYRQEFYAWDYLANNPAAGVTGVGLGQYFSVLNREYGVGAGFGENGGLVPLNSLFLEMLFDLGGGVAVLFYLGILALIWRLRRAGEHFLCLALLFVTLQSLTILTLQFMVLIAGVGCARLSLRSAARAAPLPVFVPSR